VSDVHPRVSQSLPKIRVAPENATASTESSPRGAARSLALAQLRCVASRAWLDQRRDFESVRAVVCALVRPDALVHMERCMEQVMGSLKKQLGVFGRTAAGAILYSTSRECQAKGRHNRRWAAIAVAPRCASPPHVEEQAAATEKQGQEGGRSLR